MKNFGLLLLGIVVGALAMYFYCCNNQTDMTSEPPVATPKGIITSKQASVLDAAYDIKHRIINDSLYKKSADDGDNRSSWWSIEDIQGFINHAENQAGELGYTMDGLRAYLGAHPNIKGEAGLTTIFIVPTGTVNTSQGSLFPMPQGGSHDIKGADGLNMGNDGIPPGANYPQ